MKDDEQIPLMKGDVIDELNAVLGNPEKDESSGVQAIKELNSDDVKRIKLKTEIKDLSDNFYVGKLFGISMLMSTKKNPQGWSDLRIIAEEDLKSRVSLKRKGREESVRICNNNPNDNIKRSFLARAFSPRM